MLIDMDLGALLPTAPETTSSTDTTEGAHSSQGDLKAKKAGLGSLMKAAKQNVEVPEFDMSSFF